MNLRTLFLLVISGSVLLACSATGPVRNFSGTRPKQEIAVVTFPAAITVRSIDGKNVDAPSKLSGTYDVQLTPGYHIIAFRYELYWGDSLTGRYIKTNEVGVDSTFEAGKSYEIQYNPPHSFAEASDKQFQFHATLVDLDNGQKSESFDIDNLQTTVATRFANRNKPAATPTTQAMPAAAPSTTLTADAAVSQDPVKRLKFWWLMANPQQRQEFSAWMKTATENFAPSSNPPPDTAPTGTIDGVKLKP